MKNITKLICIFLVLVMTVSCFASCQDTTGDNQNGNNTGDNQDNQNPPEDKPEIIDYIANVQIKFATDDYKMKDAVSGMNSSAVINYHGEDISVNAVSEVNGVKVENIYTLIGGILYHSLTVTSGELSVSDMKKADFASENKDEFVSEIGQGASIDTDDFKNVDKSSFGELVSFSCSDITDEAKAELVALVSEKFQAIGATVEIEDADYQLDMKNDKYVSSTLSCHYEITAEDGATYSVTMRIISTYDYETGAEVLAPVDVDKYTEVSYDEII